MIKKSGTDVYLRRFPDGRSEAKNFPLPLYFENLDQTDNALYIAGGANDKGEFERESAYFEIIVKECPDNLFGEGCKNRCNCGKNGVCHPVIGSCVCRAGFYGARCERRCPLDSFGSYCQFSCGREHFGDEFSHIKRNCRGLTFCLPKPLGCTCAFGYEGYLCDEFSNLTFPYLNQSPSVKMTSDTEIEIQFDEWKEGQEGSTYGLQISSYSIYIENFKRGEVKPSKKVLKYKLEENIPSDLSTILSDVP
ncbi:Tyrosine-protein kinase receptor Tie-1 [Armadillidium vulgare]|nr:Tyrosine-protein kinase receptor Tie-1 [Armadillidium vulgare]